MSCDWALQSLLTNCYYELLQDVINWQMVRATVLNATFNNMSAISWWMKPKHPEKTNDLQQFAYKLYHSNVVLVSHNVVLSTPRHERDSNSQRYWLYALIA
jgi:hypothetical protein